MMISTIVLAVYLKEAYSESELLFEIMHYTYVKALGEIHNYAKAANSNNMVLTGNAGNGKNHFCSIVELALKYKKPVLLFSSRDIGQDIDESEISVKRES